MTNPNRFDGGALGGSIVVNVMAPRKVGKIPFNSEDDSDTLHHIIRWNVFFSGQCRRSGLRQMGACGKAVVVLSMCAS